MSIPQSFLQELLARIDVVEVVGRHVQLKKGGANYMGLCPFHGEKSPSFSVSPSKQFYHCFGCGANGDAISFLMAHTGMSFIEAVKDLSQQAGLAVPEEQATPQERERLSAQRDHHSALTTLLATIAAGYQKHLKTSQRAIGYLKSRGLSGQIAKIFGLGFAPEGWRTLASMVPDYSDERLVESGMVIAKEGAATPTDGEARGSRENDSIHINQEKRYDRFRDRIMFPIRNVKGETIGFGGRVLDRGEPKYLNSPETPVFSKGRELYGLFEARTAIRQQGFALVTEGYMDVVALAQLGFPNAVATLGTACTPDHIQKLFRFTESVVFSFDGDAAGRRAAVKAMHAALPFATDTRSIKFLFLPAEHDPDSFIRAHGTEAFAVSVQDALPLSQFILETAQAQCDMSTPEGRARMTSHAKPLWAALPDGTLKRQMLKELAKRVDLTPQDISDLWKLAPSSPAPTASFSQPTEASQATDPRARGDQTQSPAWSDTGHPAPRAPDAWQRPSRNNPGRRFFRREPQAEPRLPPPQLNTRAELAAKILLHTPTTWDCLTAEDHQLLANLPEPLSALLAWAEEQWHEHGAQPWPVLRQQLSGHPLEPVALGLLAEEHIGQSADSGTDMGEALNDAKRELREVLRRMLVDELMAQETIALADATRRPESLQRYRELHDRRCALQKQIELKSV